VPGASPGIDASGATSNTADANGDMTIALPPDSGSTTGTTGNASGATTGTTGNASGATTGTTGNASGSTTGATGNASGATTGAAADASASDGSPVGNAGARWIPSKNTTFYWELANAPPDNTKNVGAYDIDGWGNTASEVAALHAMGVKVVCYMDVGSYEPGRPDASSFPATLKGNGVQGWPGEIWLDVRPSGPSYSTLQSLMLARFKVCQSKGFDAVEPDNMDSYLNNPGFPTTSADQLAFNEWVAATVHGLGMAVFQKNDLDQIPTLVSYFDGILDEQCNTYSECSKLAPYTNANKPAWDAEYTSDGQTTAAFCPADTSAGIVGALFALSLNGSVFQPCPNDIGRIH
jgi:hypothetical protein